MRRAVLLLVVGILGLAAPAAELVCLVRWRSQSSPDAALDARIEGVRATCAFHAKEAGRPGEEETRPFPAPPPLSAARPSVASGDSPERGGRHLIETRVVRVEDDVRPARVILCVGATGHVERGSRFTVSRRGAVVGEVIVTKVLARSCVGRVLSVKDGATIQAFDVAVTLLE